MPVFVKEASEQDNSLLSEDVTNDNDQKKEKGILSEGEMNTDGRKQYDWKSKYPVEARLEMKHEAIYIAIILVLALGFIFLHWLGYLGDLLCLDTMHRAVFDVMVYYFLSGLLGGTTFGIKYFYRAIARGYWSQDRRYWRIFSPWISSAIALIVGCMVISGFINSAKPPSNYLAVCLGFFAGYFADDAVGKMSEVAKALFGSSGRTK